MGRKNIFNGLWAARAVDSSPNDIDKGGAGRVVEERDLAGGGRLQSRLGTPTYVK